MARRKDKREGFGRLLDVWVPPEDAGNPVGCIATSFTFSPLFFEEECLGRFLQLETDPNEDGPFYLIEREEKLSHLACAAALVDQHHCKGSRSLRWDLLPVRMKYGVLHAKICLLHWAQLVRLIISSANLTEDGYRRNQEIYGVVDFKPGGRASLSILQEVVKFLREDCQHNLGVMTVPTAALARVNGLLDRILDISKEWGIPEEEHDKENPRLKRSKVHCMPSTCNDYRISTMRFGQF